MLEGVGVTSGVGEADCVKVAVGGRGVSVGGIGVAVGIRVLVAVNLLDFVKTVQDVTKQ